LWPDSGGKTIVNAFFLVIIAFVLFGLLKWWMSR